VAYYIAGYSVEIALKACIMKLVEETGVIFTDRKFVEKCWTHNIGDLVVQSGLTAIRGIHIAGDPKLGSYWLIVETWSETSRYETKSEFEARSLIEAITDPQNGVFQWIRQHW
jgi:hypothetical protein